eukprot:g4915.t1
MEMKKIFQNFKKIPSSRYFTSVANWVKDVEVVEISKNVFRTVLPLSSRYSINGHPNGGLLMGMAAGAIRETVKPIEDQIAMSGMYIAPLLEDVHVEFCVNVKKKGRNFAVASVSASQDGKERVHFSATFGKLSDAKTNRHLRKEGMQHRISPNKHIVNLPPISSCSLDLVKQFREFGFGTLSETIDFYAPDNCPYVNLATGKTGGDPKIKGYLGFRKGMDGGNNRIDPSLDSLCLFNDCLPPPVLIYSGLSSWVPTLELTVYFFQKPAPGLLQVQYESSIISNELVLTETKIFDSESELVSTSSQMCLVT